MIIRVFLSRMDFKILNYWHDFPKFMNKIPYEFSFCRKKRIMQNTRIDLQVTDFVSRRDDTGKSTVVLDDSYSLGWFLRCISVTCTGYERISYGCKFIIILYSSFCGESLLTTIMERTAFVVYDISGSPKVDESQKSPYMLHISNLKSYCIIFLPFIVLMPF